MAHGETYEEFVNKFKPKKTTDDCYTPPEIYSAIKDWAVEKYGLQGRKIRRPFWPGGDYESEIYGSDSIVIDNPPFSILSKIVRFYMQRGIPFFLFAPTRTLFSTAGGRCNYVVAGVSIVYENGATIPTSFVTNMGEFKITSCPDLTAKLKGLQEVKKELSRYNYPKNVISAASLQAVAPYIEIKIKDAWFIRKMDGQGDKTIFGSGFLISDNDADNVLQAKRAADEAKRAADEAKRTIWELSEREKEIVTKLNYM